jgi:hypothetical protein
MAKNSLYVLFARVFRAVDKKAITFNQEPELTRTRTRTRTRELGSVSRGRKGKFLPISELGAISATGI